MPEVEVNPPQSNQTVAASQLAARLDEQILGEPRVLTAAQLSTDAHVDEEFAEDYWRALGLPIAEPEKRAFTHADAAALEEIDQIAQREGFDSATVSTLIRSVGHTTDRLALWQIEALVDNAVRTRGLADAEARRDVIDRLPSLLPVLESQLVHAWRRQLAAWAGRYAIEFAESSDDTGGALPLLRAVGFVDIVQFTKRTAGLGSRELASFVQRFENNARDLISARGGRVVKTIGDAVLFIADDAATGAEIALGLSAQGSDASTPLGVPPVRVRVSMVWGRVLSRFGDVFGPSVNLASRLTEEAEPGEVLVDVAAAAELQGDSRFDVQACEAREVQGLGAIVPWQLGARDA